MGRKRLREGTTSESSSDSDDMLVPSCSREACQRRFPDQELRDRCRRRRLVHRRQKRRFNNTDSDSTSSEEGGQTEGNTERRRRHRFQNSRPAAPPPAPEPERAAVEEDKKWFTIGWREIIVAVLAVILVILFLETYIGTYLVGRPPYRFTSYLCFFVVICAVWYFFMMQKQDN